MNGGFRCVCVCVCVFGRTESVPLYVSLSDAWSVCLFGAVFIIM